MMVAPVLHFPRQAVEPAAKRNKKVNNFLIQLENYKELEESYLVINQNNVASVEVAKWNVFFFQER